MMNHYEENDQLLHGVSSTFRVLDNWKLSEQEIQGILGYPVGSQLAAWRAGDMSAITKDTIARLRLIGEIYKMLLVLSAHGAEWLRQPLSYLSHHTPMERMTSGDPHDLKSVRDYLKFHMATPMVKVDHN